jgi:hypothetical protein
MANDKDLKLLAEGVTFWNRRQGELWKNGPQSWIADFDDADFSQQCLAGVDFDLCRLRRASFFHTNLDGAHFLSANLSGADLYATSLVGADLEYASLAETQLVGVNLKGANLRWANLHSAVFSDVNLDETDLSECEIGGTFFGDCDLSHTRGLESVQHLGPCHIGLDTIYKSKGNISEAFLRGCGVPESFITQMHSLVGTMEGIQFYSCFISYCSIDAEFASRLHGRMRDAHLGVWFAPEDTQGGKKLHDQIEAAIRVYDKLLIVLSEASLKSEWVMTELRKARKAERQSGKRKLFPVRLVDFEILRDWECFDADSGKDLAAELREYFIPDFSNWKDHDEFELAFSRLLQDLKADDRTV